MSKKIKPNRYKPEPRDEEGLRSDSGTSIDFCLKCIMTVAFISILSLASIFAYDVITQSPFFSIKNIEISGAKRVSRKDILKLARLTQDENIFRLNLYTIEKQIVSHPWIQSARIKRDFSSNLFISVIEHEPLAIVQIENLADIIINTQGQPFKEYNPQKDRIEDLPVISGLDLTPRNDQYLFNGPLFNSIMEFLNTDHSGSVKKIQGDKNTGILIDITDSYNLTSGEQGTIRIKLGFSNFTAKLKKAKKISEYIDKNFPDRTICAMDLFNIEKVFIKTTRNDALRNTIEKGV